MFRAQDFQFTYIVYDGGTQVGSGLFTGRLKGRLQHGMTKARCREF